MSRILIAVLFVTACVASAQTASDRLNSRSPIWQPPTLEFPEPFPPATVSQEMITTLRVAGVQIILDQTPLIDAQKKLGGTIGQRGDASESLHWLCFYGTDKNGRWALWLESDEMGGGSIDAFTLQRIDRNAKPDRRCRGVSDGGINLPIKLDVGLTETQVRKTLGTPTAKFRDTLIFDHEHQETVRNELFTESNIVAVALRRGVVWAIGVWKSGSD